jgi:hypothetical protein
VTGYVTSRPDLAIAVTGSSDWLYWDCDILFVLGAGSRLYGHMRCMSTDHTGRNSRCSASSGRH